MRINIGSFGGRAHMLDLARELEKMGHNVKFYSYVPTSFAMKFGLKKHNDSNFWILTLPFILLFKIYGKSHKLLYYYRCIYDIILGLYMRKCDIFIGQVPMHVFSLKMAKKRFNAITISDTGISHIKIYSSILSKIGAYKENYLDYQRYINGYKYADYISVASEFVQKGFIQEGVNSSKLLFNPYGVDISNFHPTELDKKDTYDLIIVGQWSKRKGSDMVISVAQELNLSVLHVGSIVDVEFPKNNLFTHIEPQFEKKLIEYYQKCKLFVFPSQEDGFGLVLIQAVACGLPIVCSPNTGGPTLKHLLNDTEGICIMKDITTDALKNAILQITPFVNSQVGIRNYASHLLDKVSWSEYGKRYNNNLIRIITNK